MAPVLHQFGAFPSDHLSDHSRCSPTLQRLKGFILSNKDFEPQLIFIFALEAGMVNFVKFHCELENPPSLPKVGCPLLYHVLHGYVVETLCSRRHVIPIETLRYIFQSG